MPKVLSPAQVEAFEREGFVAPVRAISEERALYYRRKLEAFETRYPNDRIKLDQKAHMICPWIDEMIREPGVLDATEDLIGADILCWGTSLRAKQPDGKTFAGWHQDTAYADVKPIVVIVALALSPARTENGCIRGIPGSHRGPLLPHKEAFATNSLLSREQFIDAAFDQTRSCRFRARSRRNRVVQQRHHPLIECRISATTAASSSCWRWYRPMPISTNRVSRRFWCAGSDSYGNFDVDPQPRTEMGTAELAAWQRAVEIQSSVLFRGAQRPARALHGMTSGQAPSGV